ncbi:hypothetical protein ACVWZV_009171 [Bradyrhizobium sp. GM5.1]
MDNGISLLSVEKWRRQAPPRYAAFPIPAVTTFSDSSDACPNMHWLIKGGEIRQWKDLLAAAEVARPTLAISPSAGRGA